MLERTAPAFVEMVHRIVWASVATVGADNRPRSRVLHPVWEWDGSTLTGWVGTEPTAIKRAHLSHSPYMSVTYWSPTHDTATAECRAEWILDEDGCVEGWDRLKNAPEPVGYDPAIIPVWKDGPTSAAFAVLRLDPWRLRVQPASVLMGQGGDVLTWAE
jgi:hypothetical protein